MAKEKPPLLYAETFMEFRRRGRTRLKDWVAILPHARRKESVDYAAELKKLDSAAPTVPVVIIEVASLFDEGLGMDMLDMYLDMFSRVPDKPIGEELRLLTRAGYLTDLPALGLLEDGHLISRPQAAYRLHYQLHRPGLSAPDIVQVREGLRMMVIAAMADEPGYSEVIALCTLLNEACFPTINNRVPTILEEVQRLTEIAVADGRWCEPELVAQFDRLVALGLVYYRGEEKKEDTSDMRKQA